VTGCGPVAPSGVAPGGFSPVCGEVRLSGGALGERQNRNETVGLRHGWRMLQASGVAGNFELVASGRGVYSGETYSDSDFYKWLEGAIWQSQMGLAGDLEEAVERSVALVARAQLPDGYVNTYVQHHWPDRRWQPDNPHEFYNLSHLVQAGVAAARCPAGKDLFEIARRAADQAERTVTGEANIWNLGHPGIEMALVELYRATGVERYLRLARKILGFRGERRELLIGSGLSEWEDVLLPDPWDPELRGHAVCALYLAAGMADLLAELGEERVSQALGAKWQDLVLRKAYVTGNAGARHAGEAFGDAYELPSGRAYCETCAAVAIAMWSWRMLLLRGEAAYADWFEKVLYNAVLAGAGADGTKFFYANRLESRGDIERSPWYRCPCCPTNVMRFLAQVNHYVVTQDASGSQVQQFVPCDVRTVLRGAGEVSFTVTTRYPFEGHVSVVMDNPGREPWELSLRSPEWCRERPTVWLNDVPVEETVAGRPGYLGLRRFWERGDRLVASFPMQAGFVEADRRVRDVRGMVAAIRGPLVYCAEGVDQSWRFEPERVRVLVEAGLREGYPSEPDGRIGEHVTLRAAAYLAGAGADGPLYRPLGPRAENVPGAGGPPVDLVFVPYYLWANRGRSAMGVWLDASLGTGAQ
jgi:DUF1680 family protein